METKTVQLLGKVLDYSSLKQKVISENIANIATENYRRKDVDFADFLKESQKAENIKNSNSRHIKLNTSEIDLPKNVIKEGDSTASGKNNVNIDQEMAEMAKNSLLFKFASQKINGHFKKIQTVIKGGR